MRVMRRLICVLIPLLLAIPLLAQTPRLSFGAIGGVRLTDGVPRQDESRRYTVGPAIEAGFGDHLAVEFNALYKRYGSSFQPLGSVGIVGGILGVRASGSIIGPPYEYLYYATRSRAHSWEFPLLGKYYFGGRSRTPRLFVQTGYAFQRSWTENAVSMIQKNVETGEVSLFNQKYRSHTPVSVGAVFGGGFTRKAGPVTIAPSFRYTRWGVRYDGANRNQAEFLLGLWF